MITQGLLLLALVCFAIGAYVTPDLSTKLERIGLCALTIAFLVR